MLCNTVLEWNQLHEHLLHNLRYMLQGPLRECPMQVTYSSQQSAWSFWGENLDLRLFDSKFACVVSIGCFSSDGYKGVFLGCQCTVLTHDTCFESVPEY